MPTYDYVCEACGHKFEAFQSIKAEPIKICPACEKNTVRRLIGMGGGIIFKGSGFYCTDYRDSSYKAAAKSDKSGSSS
jgi:putative FmdB family regulatory protein